MTRKFQPLKTQVKKRPEFTKLNETNRIYTQIITKMNETFYYINSVNCFCEYLLTFIFSYRHAIRNRNRHNEFQTSLISEKIVHLIIFILTKFPLVNNTLYALVFIRNKCDRNVTTLVLI